MDYLNIQDIFTSARLPYLIGGSVMLLSVYAIGKSCTRKRSKIQVTHGTVLVYQFGRGPTCPSLSPFCLKFETFLRMYNIPYKTDLTMIKSPKGKWPWMTYNGVDVADSQFCIEHLKKELSLEPNSHLSDEQRGQAHAVRRMLEDGTLFAMGHQRWRRRGPAYEFMMNLIPLPRFLTNLLFTRRFEKIIWYQGNKKFLMGDEPCEEDCTVFGFLYQAKCALPGTIGEALLKGECSNLSAYCDRMKEKFWPDWDQCLAAQDK